MRNSTICKFLGLALIVSLSGCSAEQDNINDANVNGPHINLSIFTCEPEIITRADVDGENDYNENTINTFYYYFFSKNVTDQPAIVKGVVSGIDRKDSYTEQIPVSSNILNGELFSSDRQCSLFIIANPTESFAKSLETTPNPTLAQLRTITIASTLNNIPQKNFVMVYDDLVTMASRAEDDAVEASIIMKRLACKFTFKADVLSLIETNDGTRDISWRPSTSADALTVTFGNALNVTTPAGFNKSNVDEDKDYFETTPVELEYNGTSSDKTIDSKIYKTYTAKSPVYSYPMEWVFTDNVEPYILYDLIWDYDDGANQHQEHRYYKLMLGQQSITSNDWYVITAKLSGLGNLLPRDPLVLFSGLNYSVSKWNDAFSSGVPNTPANIKDARYLMVPQTRWEVNNETECVIPISTSHPCEVVNVVVKKMEFHKEGYVDEFGNTRPNKPHEVTVVDEANDITNSDFTFTPNADWSKLTFHHEVHNSLDDNLDVSPYWIELDVQHNDNSSFTEHISITQFPAIWVESELNSAGEDGRSPYKGFVYVNGGQAGGSNWNLVGGTNREPDSDDSNSSRYMAVIHVSQFQSSAQFKYKDDTNGGVYAYAPYLIGDPRVTTPNNLDTNSSSEGIQWTVQNPVQKSALFENSSEGRQLKYYYPTSRDFEHSQFVAPVLRVCSGQGRFGQNKEFQDVEQRCASYQEDGYPAGRWRLPTMAEASLIIFLSGKFIPSIFQKDSGDYAFANGDTKDLQWGYIPFVTANKGLNVRCVYDEWYWSEVDKKLGRKHGSDLTVAERQIFVWGDVPRDYTIVP